MRCWCFNDDMRVEDVWKELVAVVVVVAVLVRVVRVKDLAGVGDENNDVC